MVENSEAMRQALPVPGPADLDRAPALLRAERYAYIRRPIVAVEYQDAVARIELQTESNMTTGKAGFSGRRDSSDGPVRE